MSGMPEDKTSCKLTKWSADRNTYHSSKSLSFFIGLDFPSNPLTLILHPIILGHLTAYISSFFSLLIPLIEHLRSSTQQNTASGLFEEDDDTENQERAAHGLDVEHPAPGHILSNEARAQWAKTRTEKRSAYVM